MNSSVAVFICALLTIVSCQINPNDNKEYVETKNKCLAETGATEKMVTDSFGGVYSDAPEFAKYLFCMGKLSGMMDDDGNVNKEEFVKKMMKFGIDEAKLRTALDKCVNGKRNLDTIVASTKCVFDEAEK